MKRLLLGLLVTLPLCSQDTLGPKIYSFEKNWSPFLHRYFGCPDDTGPIDTEHCKPDLGQIDNTLWINSCEASKKLWLLEGNCK